MTKEQLEQNHRKALEELMEILDKARDHGEDLSHSPEWRRINKKANAVAAAAEAIQEHYPEPVDEDRVLTRKQALANPMTSQELIDYFFKGRGSVPIKKIAMDGHFSHMKEYMLAMTPPYFGPVNQTYYHFQGTNTAPKAGPGSRSKA